MNSQAYYEIPQWAISHQGRSIALYHSHPLNALASLAPVLFVGGVHGDEPEGVHLADSLIASLKETPAQGAWALITCLNPDGHFKNERVNSRGVDLNRNFPTRDWIQSESKDRYYSGDKPASENETQALVRLIDQIKPQLLIHFHSWKPCIVYTGEPARLAAETLSGPGYPVQSDIGYPTPGSLGQYGWLEKSLPVVCIEEAEQASKAQTWERFGEGLRRIADSQRGGDV